ncbi:flavin reductase family protein [Nocardioides sp. cx-169]|uniref:flavin reductase family protein n=1 Tax=Nocardioides sp. cx-169 TaxID=2899080 RepID=UPI001E5F2F09|nr:flavin reductase family protein [Nocardioides sp. cx-169]MCD4532899.1 flavin reductase family protein [Nocardioides sp. cx-169]
MTTLRGDHEICREIQTELIDPLAFRNAVGHYASGITVITGETEGVPVGFTCQSFYSVSAVPPLVSFSVMLTSTSYPPIRETGKFAVNVLAHDQDHVSNQFARSGTDKWDGIGWAPARSNNPIVDDCLMWLDCEIEAEHVAGDHLIVIGRVVEMSRPTGPTAAPLLYFKGRYCSTSDITN